MRYRKFLGKAYHDVPESACCIPMLFRALAMLASYAPITWHAVLAPHCGMVIMVCHFDLAMPKLETILQSCSEYVWTALVLRHVSGIADLSPGLLERNTVATARTHMLYIHHISILQIPPCSAIAHPQYVNKHGCANGFAPLQFTTARPGVNERINVLSKLVHTYSRDSIWMNQHQFSQTIFKLSQFNSIGPWIIIDRQSIINQPFINHHYPSPAIYQPWISC